MWPASLVGIAFLSYLGSLQIGLDAVDYLFDLNDKVRAKDHPFTRLDLVYGCTTVTAIQSFKGCHSETLMIIVVVRELGQWQTLVPFVWVVQYTSSEHVLKNLIYSFGLWMIC
jgi:hypothetical protein